jgi:DNA-directed RNA polymerase subunit RPC12/RpoP
MIRYSCNHCQRTLLIKPSLAGQSSACPCGVLFTVPQAAKAAAPLVANSAAPKSQPTQPAQQPRSQPVASSNSLVVSCSKCNRQLRAPSTAADKAVRCPCGQLVMVPSQKATETKRGSTVVSVVRNESNNDWLKSLPPPQVLNAPPPQNGAEFWYVDADPEDYEPPPPVTVPDAKQLSHEYIRGAEKELREQRRQGSSGALGAAQVLMILVGLTTIGLNGFLLYNAPNEVQQVIKDEDAGFSETALLRVAQTVYGVFIALGITMIILGALIYQFPVFCPLAGLIIYILAMIISGVLNPSLIFKGIIFKVLTVVALGKAVGDGASYRG